MTLLICGVILFAAVHFLPSLGLGAKQKVLSKLGEGGYKGVFSLLLLAALAMIVFGWRSAVPTGIYSPPPELRHAAMLVMLFAIYLFVVAARSSRVKHWLRHPQLTGVALWSAAHLLANGDSRSIILFGGMGLWAIFEMFAINRREGAWVKSASPGWGTEAMTIFIAAVVVAILIRLHPYISGMPLM